MAAATTLIPKLRYVPSPSFYSCFTRNTYHVSFHSQNTNNTNQSKNSQRFRIHSTPKPISTGTRKPISLYLIQNLGFSEEQSLTISKNLLRLRKDPRVPANQVTDLISFENADKVIKFLQDENECGFNQSQIKQMVIKLPNILMCNVDKTLRPKITLLQNVGFSTSDLAYVLSRNPYLYLRCDLTPTIQALRGIMGSDENVVKFLRRLSWGSANNIITNLVPNVTMLENEFGIPRDKIMKILTQQPGMFMNNTETLRDIAVKMEDKWGISRDSTLFLRALKVFSSRTDETINSKCQVFRNFGWSHSDILSLIRRQPMCLEYSEEKIKKSLEFFMNELGYEPAFMLTRVNLFTLSFECRVAPRHRVLKILKEKGFVKDSYQLTTAIKFTESMFSERFILPYANRVPNLLEVYAYGEAMPDEENKSYVAAE